LKEKNNLKWRKGKEWIIRRKKSSKKKMKIKRNRKIEAKKK
jgi:hypothetical protein